MWGLGTRKARWAKAAIVLSLTVLCAASSGCVSRPAPEVTIHESPQGAVYLARVDDQAFHTSHPVELDRAVIARALRGVHIQPRQGAITTFVFGPPASARAFSDDDVAFLSPQIVTALSQATQRQIVGFRVRHTRATGSETTAGTLYVRGPSFYLTLTQHRYRSDTASADDAPDFTGLYQSEVWFVPAGVLRPDTSSLGGIPSHGDLTTLVIDHELLAKLLEPLPAPAAAPAAQPERPTSVELTVPPTPERAGQDQKEAELEKLKEEIRELKRKIAEQELELKKLRKKRKDAR